ncbi:FAD/NAD(P)-binding domain-containing protein [Punctularia strigosozonata HHB-11173 SS5]|uniref:FAD/NAD(P)-binding domain-containing protein n=1 Tax=Punctularia strigosozonata (strain HHB-11173) TaxID=741275 RepID=UPI0004416666|nr:FAD/NAD(P)-binding domain-containing protein [Punctularia strigosozonata HHB-11173 SS5]EIN14739.1 FAD/NAD(P)-binding domain-containing protein [Punctularia strigosozonata HHB-11173 SS5]
MAQGSDKSGITIAIVGGGLGGVCAAVGLGRAGYSVHLFEQAEKFSEIGAGISLGPNAITALEMLGLGDTYEKIADITDDVDPLWFQFVEHRDGSMIQEVFSKGRYSSVHRAKLLDGFMKHLPSNVKTHFGSHITHVENVLGADGKPARVRLSIEPHGEHHPDWPQPDHVFEASVVIGCDGVKSMVRKSIEEYTGGRVRYTGSYAYRGLLDTKEAVAQIGEGATVPTMWLALDKHILSFPIEKGNVINVVAFVSDRSSPPDERVWKESRWVKPVPVDQMLGDFEGFEDKVIKLMKLIKKPEQWALHELVPLKQWTVDRITLLGDAAHAALPNNGAGAGQAIEDVYVLASLLSDPRCTETTLPEFLLAYENVRRGRASAQQVHSREGGEVYEYRGPTGSDRKALAENLKGRFDWIWVHDLRADVKDAFASLAAKGIIS